MNRRLVVAALAAVLLLGACSSPSSSTAPTVDVPTPQPSASQPMPGSLVPKGELFGPFPVTKVVDGDTIWVGSGTGDVKVRLIGIDTAETVDPNEPVGCFGPEASAEAARLLTGASVYLELDPSQGDIDRYGRTLAYVWLEDGSMFNEVMIRDGFAIEYTYDDPYAYQAEFRDAQSAAQDQGAGLWSACGGPA